MKLIKLSVALLLTIGITSCKKDKDQSPLAQNETKELLTKVVHNYTYSDEKYSVIYFMNKDNKAVDYSGDMEKHLQNLETVKETNGGFLITDISNNGKKIDMMIFNTIQDVDRYQGREATDSPEWDCNDWDNEGQGTATYRFFRHTNYQALETHLNKDNVTFFKDQWLDNANNEISSIQLIGNGQGISVTCFIGSCYFDYWLRFTESVPNLHSILASWNGRPNAQTLDMGDQISSLKGWSF